MCVDGFLVGWLVWLFLWFDCFVVFVLFCYFLFKGLPEECNEHFT